MIAVSEAASAVPLTDGDIAVNNLESARLRAWGRFWSDPTQANRAEAAVAYEQIALQFLGDSEALDRMEKLAHHLECVEADAPRTALVSAQVASTAHRFSDARRYLAHAAGDGELATAVERLSLNIDQACGKRLDVILEERRKAARDPGRLDDLVSLGALYADLRMFGEADQAYQQALKEYQDTCPFAVAWACFQRGVLWGELVPDPHLERAASCYQKAIACLPQYVKARVHLAEIHIRSGDIGRAEALLVPAVSTGDPEVHWRLSEVLSASGRSAEAVEQSEAARSRFDSLLKNHILAYADHGAEFYAGYGNDAQRAFELARINFENRPTLRACELAYRTAVAANRPEQAAEVRASAVDLWGYTPTLEGE